MDYKKLLNMTRFNKSILLIIVILCALIYGEKIKDPQPTGGAICETYVDCGGFNAGKCTKVNSDDNEGVCECYKEFGNPNCSYERKHRGTAGGLMFLCLAGIGGVGNFILERTTVAITQLCLMFSLWLACIGVCIVGGVMVGLGGDGGVVVGYIIIVIFYVLCIGALLTGWVWCIADAIGILSGTIADGNGYATYS